MENANPPPPNNPHIFTTALQKLSKNSVSLRQYRPLLILALRISSNSSMDLLLMPMKIDMNEVEFGSESVDTPLDSSFLDSDSDSNDGEVLNELYEYGNARTLRHRRVINGLEEMS
ncbi:hypothetical protein Tco_0307782 [Tanacetum coccineum]